MSAFVQILNRLSIKAYRITCGDFAPNISKGCGNLRSTELRGDSKTSRVLGCYCWHALLPFTPLCPVCVNGFGSITVHDWEGLYCFPDSVKLTLWCRTRFENLYCSHLAVRVLVLTLYLRLVPSYPRGSQHEADPRGSHYGWLNLATSGPEITCRIVGLLTASVWVEIWWNCGGEPSTDLSLQIS